MLVFPNAKLVFLSMPKTGTTAYEAALAPYAAMTFLDPPALKHASVFRYGRFFKPMMDKFVHPRLELMAVIREPVSWLHSWYRYRQRPFLNGKPNSTAGISFDDFVKACMLPKRPAFADVGTQIGFLKPHPDGAHVQHLFRYEDQAAIISFLETRLNTRLDLKRENVSPAKPLQLSDNVRAAYQSFAREEFDLWNATR